MTEKLKHRFQHLMPAIAKAALRFKTLMFDRTRVILPAALTACGIWYWQCLPASIFADPKATVLLDRDGNLLGARIASDGQWRFPPGDSVAAKFETCLLRFEDRQFYKHRGVSIRAILRALASDLKEQRIVSGGSTITMQLARMMRGNPPRTFLEKLIEMIIATRLELRYNKKELLGMYAANAPMGNNVVGLEAASWRYYGVSAGRLSWAQAATLAVLPNAPGLIYPGKNHERLLTKRNRLLKSLYKAQYIDAVMFELALTEPLPRKPLPLPAIAPHLVTRLAWDGRAALIVKSTLSKTMQQRTAALLADHMRMLAANKIFNGAVLISSVQTGEVLAYVGNTSGGDVDHAPDVDCIMAARSTGSIFKPLLFASALREGLITPTTLLTDVPVSYGNFRPQNYSRQCDGAIPANIALARSLNIPFVKLLNDYGLAKFRDELAMYFPTVTKPASHYGLSLILGGAEATLWDVNAAYLDMAQRLMPGVGSDLTYNSFDNSGRKRRPDADAACIFATFEAMVEANRPDDDGSWRVFSNPQKIAWKTGTSFGNRDAWAIGVTPAYVISVWLGNAAGDGRPGLTGINAAAPLLFNLFSAFPARVSWFKKPVQNMSAMAICRQSGNRAGEHCVQADTAMLPASCVRSSTCSWHRLVHLDNKGKYRVNSACENALSMQHVPWFILPPLMAKYYKAKHPEYLALPPLKPGCQANRADRSLHCLYPKPGSKIYVPVELAGEKGKTVFEAIHRDQNITMYWHLDDTYLGATNGIHQMMLSPAPGRHTLLLADENGQEQEVEFEIIK